jgi:hypothetical protein
VLYDPLIGKVKSPLAPPKSHCGKPQSISVRICRAVASQSFHQKFMNIHSTGDSFCDDLGMIENLIARHNVAT